MGSNSTDSTQAKNRWGFRTGKTKAKEEAHPNVSTTLVNDSEHDSEKKLQSRTHKKMPVFFFDEAHKLSVIFLSSIVFSGLITVCYTSRPALIKSTDTMKCLLDSMLVLTKQDRLCHVIHATSDPFYQTWLRQLNVMQHCKVRLCFIRSCCLSTLTLCFII